MGDATSLRFEPLRPASRARLIAGAVVGPLLWLVALIVAAWLFEYSWAIGFGLLVTVVALVVSLIVLAVLHSARRRAERR
jgi:ABC-type transport system involved in multi-copper enzyme maturation permease subunit